MYIKVNTIQIADIGIGMLQVGTLNQITNSFLHIRNIVTMVMTMIIQ